MAGGAFFGTARWLRLLPQDSDRSRIVFGPEAEAD